MVRLPDIARRVLSENELEPGAAEAIRALIREIPESQVRLLRDRSAPDSPDWDSYLKRLTGQNWLQIPWFAAEAYFYRRVLEATGYFEAGPGFQVDPFLGQKEAGLSGSQATIQALAELIEPHSRPGGWDPGFFATLVKTDLWGNQADLSLWPAGKGDKPDHASVDQAQAFLLVDHAQACANYIESLNKPLSRVDFLADNAGFELVVDLALAETLLSCEAAAQARFHLKEHPTFVSDAMGKDVRRTIEFLAASHLPETSSLGKRLSGYLESGRLQLAENLFWNSPLALWEMPEALRGELASASLVVSKGDANYRRLLGDRHWAYTTPIDQALAYFPCPLLVLRTLKSEVAVGLPEGKSEEIAMQDSKWMTDGRWGLIQFHY